MRKASSQTDSRPLMEGHSVVFVCEVLYTLRPEDILPKVNAAVLSSCQCAVVFNDETHVGYVLLYDASSGQVLFKMVVGGAQGQLARQFQLIADTAMEKSFRGLMFGVRLCDDNAGSEKASAGEAPPPVPLPVARIFTHNRKYYYEFVLSIAAAAYVSGGLGGLVLLPMEPPLQSGAAATIASTTEPAELDKGYAVKLMCRATVLNPDGLLQHVACAVPSEEGDILSRFEVAVGPIGHQKKMREDLHRQSHGDPLAAALEAVVARDPTSSGMTLCVAGDAFTGKRQWPWLMPVLSASCAALPPGLQKSRDAGGVDTVTAADYTDALRVVSSDVPYVYAMLITIEGVEPAPQANLADAVKQRLIRQGAEPSMLIETTQRHVQLSGQTLQTKSGPSAPPSGGEQATQAVPPTATAAATTTECNEPIPPKEAAAALDSQRAQSEPTTAPLPPPGQEQQQPPPPSSAADTRFSKAEAKLNRRKQRLQLMESDLNARGAELEKREAELQARETAVVNQRSVNAQTAAKLELERKSLQQLTALHQQGRIRSSTAAGSPAAANRPQRTSSFAGSDSSPGRDMAPSTRYSEGDVAAITRRGGGGSSGPTTIFRAYFEFFDKSHLPRRCFECYPSTSWLISVMLNTYVVAAIVLVLVLGIVGVAVNPSTIEQLWVVIPITVLSIMILVAVWFQRDGILVYLHKLSGLRLALSGGPSDDSLSQSIPSSASEAVPLCPSGFQSQSVGPLLLDPATLNLYPHSWIFGTAAAVVVVASLLPVLLRFFLPSLVSALTESPPLAQVAVIVSVTLSILVSMTTLLFLALCTSVAFERTAQIVLGHYLCPLSSKPQIRAAMASYPFIRRIVSELSGSWELGFLLLALQSIVFIVLAAASSGGSHAGVFPQCCTFAGLVILLGIMYCTVGFDTATRNIVAAVGLHAERWCRGDCGDSIGDVAGNPLGRQIGPEAASLGDYQQFQQFLQFALFGGEHVRWGIFHYHYMLSPSEQAELDDTAPLLPQQHSHSQIGLATRTVLVTIPPVLLYATLLAGAVLLFVEFGAIGKV